MGALAAIAIGAWFFVGQVSGSRRLAAFVPQESELIVSMNLPSLAKKVEGENLTEMALFESFMTQSSGELLPFFKQIALDPKASGMRFTDNPHFFLSKTKSTGGLLLGIKDKTKFAEVLKASNMTHSIESEGEINYLYTSDGPIILWNEQTALLYMAKDTTTLLQVAKSILVQSNPGIDELALYKDSYIKGSDVFVYLKNSFFPNQRNELIGLNIMKQSGEIAYGMSMRFKAGQIDFVSRTAFEKKEDAKFMRLYGTESGEHFLAQTTSKAPLLAAQIQFNADKLYSLLTENPSTKASLDEIAADLGVKTKELKQLFSGNVAFSFSGLEKKTVTQSFFGIQEMKEVNIPEAALFVEIQDPDLFQKVLDRGDQHPKDGKYTFSIPFIGEFFMVHNDAGVCIMMNPEMANALAESKSLSNDDFGDIGTYLKKHPNGAYVNLDLDAYSFLLRDEMQKDFGDAYMLIETGLRPFSKVYAHQKKKKGFITVHLVNKEQNALPQVLQVIDALYTLNRRIEENNQKTEEVPMLIE